MQSSVRTPSSFDENLAEKKIYHQVGEICVHLEKVRDHYVLSASRNGKDIPNSRLYVTNYYYPILLALLAGDTLKLIYSLYQKSHMINDPLVAKLLEDELKKTIAQETRTRSAVLHRLGTVDYFIDEPPEKILETLNKFSAQGDESIYRALVAISPVMSSANFPRPVAEATALIIDNFIYSAAKNANMIKMAVMMSPHRKDVLDLLLKYGAERLIVIDSALLEENVDLAYEMVVQDGNYDFSDEGIQKIRIREFIKKAHEQSYLVPSARYGYRELVEKLVDEYHVCRYMAIKGAIDIKDEHLILQLARNEEHLQWAITQIAANTQENNKLGFIQKLIDLYGECNLRGLFYATLSSQIDLLSALLKKEGHVNLDFVITISNLCGKKNIVDRLTEAHIASKNSQHETPICHAQTNQSSISTHSPFSNGLMFWKNIEKLNEVDGPTSKQPYNSRQQLT